MEWLTFRYRMGGELYYNTVEAYARGLDPWRDQRLFGGNGDGTLFYPGRAATALLGARHCCRVWNRPLVSDPIADRAAHGYYDGGGFPCTRYRRRRPGRAAGASVSSVAISFVQNKSRDR